MKKFLNITELQTLNYGVIIMMIKRILLFLSCITVTCIYGMAPEEEAASRQRVFAFLMAIHPRLGQESPANKMSVHLFQRVLREVRIQEWKEKPQLERDQALYEAAKTGNLGLLEVLLLAGSTVDWTSNNTTPLHIAVCEGHESIVRMLIAYGANINAVGGWYPPIIGGFTPLHFAADYGHERITQILLNAGAQINARNLRGETPLDLAAWKHEEVVRVLLKDPDIDINSQNSGGWAPLHAAVQNGNVVVVQMLLADSRTNVNIQTPNVPTPLKHVKEHATAGPYRDSRRESFSLIISLLQQHGAI